DDYSAQQLYAGDAHNIDRYSILSNGRAFLGGRLAHFLAVHGPNLQVDTACSGSLTALHLACQGLRNHECDLAFAGGVYLQLSPEMMIGLCQMGALSPDGRCKAFDQSANGFAMGEGCGMVLLKRLADAQADGDPISAVIRGSAINHDGHSRTVTTPNGQAQRDLLRQALDRAGISARQIQYVEAHGTGTELGDPIEVLAIADAFCRERVQEKLPPLPIGSVKSNVGHLNAAAGMAGLFKIVLALQHQELPPTLHLNQLNPRIPWEKLGVVVPTTLTPWLAQADLRVAGLSSFGLSGSNAHLIIEEAPRTKKEIRRLGDWEIGSAHPQLFTLSAKSEEALRDYARRYVGFLSEQPTINVADLCYTAQIGRNHFDYR
ncbi:MAG: short-chain dehydrogenase, partial [Chloroflexota bacterium]|nr:short-chain dehydrogenase [Chloroflexota bacterium]